MYRKLISLVLIFSIFLNYFYVPKIYAADTEFSLQSIKARISINDKVEEIECYIDENTEYMELTNLCDFVRVVVLGDLNQNKIQLCHGIRNLNLVIYDYDTKEKVSGKVKDGKYKAEIWLSPTVKSDKINLFINDDKVFVPSYPFFSLFGANCEYVDGVYYVTLPVNTIWETLYDALSKSNTNMRVMDTEIELQDYYGSSFNMMMSLGSSGLMNAYYESLNYSGLMSFLSSAYKSVDEVDLIENLYFEILGTNVFAYESANKIFNQWEKTVAKSTVNYIEAIATGANNYTEYMGNAFDFICPISDSISDFLENSPNTRLTKGVKTIDKRIGNLSTTLEYINVCSEIIGNSCSLASYNSETRELFKNVCTKQNLEKVYENTNWFGKINTNKYVKAAENVKKKLAKTSKAAILKDSFLEGIDQLTALTLDVGIDQISDALENTGNNILLPAKAVLEVLNINALLMKNFYADDLENYKSQLNASYLEVFQHQLITIINNLAEEAKNIRYTDRSIVDNLRQALLLYCKTTITLNNALITAYETGVKDGLGKTRIIKDLKNKNEYLAGLDIKLSNSSMTLFDMKWKGNISNPWNSNVGKSKKEEAIQKDSLSHQTVTYQKVKHLEWGNSCKIDLDNDGKKEKISSYFVDKENYYGNIYVKINDKNYKVSNGNAENACLYTELYITDLDITDPYKDILIVLGVESDICVAINVIRCIGNDEYFLGTASRDFLGSRIMRVFNVDGHGNFEISVENPYNSNPQFGCYYVDMSMYIDEDSIKMHDADSFEITEPDLWGVNSDSYRLARKMKLYEEASTKASVLSTLSKGTTFVPLVIKYGGKVYHEETDYYPMYVKVETSSKKIGWLYFSGEYDFENPYLDSFPAWG